METPFAVRSTPSSSLHLVPFLGAFASLRSAACSYAISSSKTRWQICMKFGTWGGGRCVRKCIYPLQLWLKFGGSRERFTWRLSRLSSWHQLMRNSLRIWVEHILGEDAREKHDLHLSFSVHFLCYCFWDNKQTRVAVPQLLHCACVSPSFFGCVKYSNLKFQRRFSVWKYYVYVNKNHLDWAYLMCLQCYCCETRRSANILWQTLVGVHWLNE